MDLRGTEWADMDWTVLAQGRNKLRPVVNTEIKYWKVLE
jgi:hypothetical protein